MKERRTAGQMDLVLEEPADKTPVASVQDVQAMSQALVGRKKAVSRAALALLLGKGWTERKVRAVARAAAPGIVSWPGSPGYKLWEECTVEEIQHAIAAFQSQARDMTARAQLYQDAYYSRYRGGQV